MFWVRSREGLLARARRLVRSVRRGNYARDLGWKVWAPLLTGRDGPNTFRTRWRIRNANRLYRLTYGHGNPWRPYKGY